MSSYCKTCVYGSAASWECEDCYDSLTGAPPTGYKEDKRSSKCSRCGFCNSLGAVAYSVPSNAAATYYLRQARAVIAELCSKQEGIPFFAQTLSDLRIDLSREKGQ